MAGGRSENTDGRGLHRVRRYLERRRGPRSRRAIEAPSGEPAGISVDKRAPVDTGGPVFLSHRGSDGTEITRELAWVLRAHGVPVWVDRDDFPPGDTDQRMEEALASGISGAIIVVTPEIAESKAVQAIELPRILDLAEENPSFTLAIANTIPDPRDPSRPDYGAPDRLLREPTSERLAKITQYLTVVEKLETLERLAADFIRERLRVYPLATEAILVVDIESRLKGSARVSRDSHLTTRLEAPDSGARALPARSLRRLSPAVALLPDLVAQSQASKIRVRGGAHLSVGFVVGAALPTTARPQVFIEDRDGDYWGAASGTASPMNEDGTTTGQEGDPIAVYVNMSSRPESNDAFDRFIAQAGAQFAGAIRLTAPRPAKVAGVDGVATASSLEQRIVAFAAQHRTHEIHLFLRVPFALSVLLGRRFNTFTVHLYEWEDNGEPTYRPAVVVASGRGGGPVVKITAEQ